MVLFIFYSRRSTAIKWERQYIIHVCTEFFNMCWEVLRGKQFFFTHNWQNFQQTSFLILLYTPRSETHLATWYSCTSVCRSTSAQWRWDDYRVRWNDKLRWAPTLVSIFFMNGTVDSFLRYTLCALCSVPCLPTLLSFFSRKARTNKVVKQLPKGGRGVVQ